jgi:hypothetical protein
MKKVAAMALIALVAMSASLTAAQKGKKPAQDVSGRRYPNLVAAQRLTAQAYSKIVAAQRANEFDREGHAQKAKELLDQANAELKLAAHAANASK